jgi:hypothetical protein
MRVQVKVVQRCAALLTLVSALAFKAHGPIPSRGCTNEEINAVWTMQYTYCSTNGYDCAYVGECCITDTGVASYSNDCGYEPCDEYFYPSGPGEC